MDKALLMCLCLIMVVGAGIIRVTSFPSQVQAPAGAIMIEDADYVANKTTKYSADFINTAKNVTPRIVVEYGDSISKLDLYKSDDLNQAASTVSSRIIVEYADFMTELGLQGSQDLIQTTDVVTPRIIVEYADSIFRADLERPLFGAEVSARIDSYSTSPRNVAVGYDVTIGFSFTNTGDVAWTFGAGATLRKPDGTRVDFLEVVTVNPSESGSAQWTYTIDMAGRWDTVFGVWKESTHPLENLLVQTGWVAEYITATVGVAGEWTFAIITDLHIGRGWHDYGADGFSDYYWNGTAHDGNEGGFNCLTDRLADVVKWINDNYEEENIKFLAILGDITDSAEMSEFYRAKKILDGLEIPCIPVIGNHDILSKIDNSKGEAKGDLYFNEIFSEAFFSQQFEKLGVIWWDKQEHTTYPYLQNYAFSYGGINFICLDYARRDIPLLDPWDVTSVIAQPFTETKTWLEDSLKNRPEKTVIVFSHYPFMLEGGVRTSITGHLGRTTFIYSRDVLTFGGHIHYCDNRNLELINQVYFVEILGEIEYFEHWMPFATQVSVPVIVTKGMMEEDKDFLRIVKVEGTYTTPNKIDYTRIVELDTCDIPDGPAPETKILEWQFPCSLTKSLWAKLGSPGELSVYDSQGQVTGLVNGEIRNEIPKSLYFEDSVVVLSAVDSYRYQVVGTKDDSYYFEVTFVTERETTTFACIDIPTSANAIHQYTIDWDALSQGEEGVTVKVDSDGDGVFEVMFTSDNELTQDEFMLQVPSAEAFPLWILGVAVATIAIATAAIAVVWRKRKQPARTMVKGE